MNVEFGDGGLSRKTTMKFTVIRAPSPYNVILGRSGLKALRAIPSTIHAMMKFPTPRGIATLVTRSVAISECRRLEDRQAPPDEVAERQGDRPLEEIMTEERKFSITYFTSDLTEAWMETSYLHPSTDDELMYDPTAPSR
ncbi:reverse transcriptase domain-containing protein [Artemisia annua]|uniref:Reverse transcriptase domain-containing protein n=1 Tax=Artemisia annua TaxID=35608 RepID=A0A2U1MW75_ARTAN|nr:reverse transcriptase domain-containing protein [Artemisia annua]